jgi:Xaa-Pro aminopeptidase
MLDTQHSKTRIARLAKLLASRGLDAAVCGTAWHVHYFGAYLQRWFHPAAVIVSADGRSCLIRSNRCTDQPAATDQIVEYEADFMFTLRQEQPQLVAERVLEILRRFGSRRVGFDAAPANADVLAHFEGETESIEPDLWQMRRVKDPDELAIMRKATRICDAMFRVARQIIRPGLDEVELFAQVQSAAVTEAGEPLTALLGNDYACGCMGGLPRAGRKAASGELYIVDVGPAYRGYFGDATRTFAVDHGRATDAQMRAWESMSEALRIVERMARPGVRCREIFEAVGTHVRRTHGVGLAHHLGHGIGAQPHEFPHLNPHWDDTLQDGEVICVEPGIYSDELRGGIRLENEYLITSRGLENLITSPLEL